MSIYNPIHNVSNEDHRDRDHDQDQDIGDSYCPVCGSLENITDLFIHIFINHPAFLLVWTSLNYPTYHRHLIDVHSIDTSMYASQATFGNSNMNEVNDTGTDNLMTTDINTEIDIDTGTDNATVTENDVDGLVNDLSNLITLLNIVSGTATYEELVEYSNIMSQQHIIKRTPEELESIASIATDEDIAEYSEDNCSVCFEILADKPLCRKMNTCGHLFCSECIESWLKIKSSCPLCRS